MTHDEAMQTVKDTRACVLYGDINWAKRVDGLADYIAALEAENAALRKVEQVAWELLAVVTGDAPIDLSSENVFSRMQLALNDPLLQSALREEQQ